MVARLSLAAAAIWALASAGWLGAGGLPGGPARARAAAHVPVLAYYYMWFNAASWTHAKTDVPALGPYDSTNPAVIRQQVTWARESGVDAFVASWKHTPQLDTALAELVAECQRQGLRLVIIYEGLDVNRNPIATATVGRDIAWFDAHYGRNPVFDVFGKPAVIWSGSWKFTASQIAAVRRQVGAPDRLLLLGSEKDAASYQARAALFDGDAYYWSSADPLSTPGYLRRLSDLGSAVQAHHGLWLAPAAVGFDARLNGGTSVVDRRDGQTLRAAWADAEATSPDAIALISWNEYTENSYVEPSRRFGMQYLDVLAGLTGAAGPPGQASSSPAAEATPSPTANPSGVPAAAIDNGGGPDFGQALGTGGPAALDWLGSLLAGGLVLAGLAALGLNLRRRQRASLRPPGSGASLDE